MEAWPAQPLPPFSALRHLDLKGLSLSIDLEGLCALSDHFPLERFAFSFPNIPNGRYCCEIKSLNRTNFEGTFLPLTTLVKEPLSRVYNPFVSRKH